MLLNEKNISLTAEPIIQELCTPFFKKTGINYFIFARFYKDGSHLCLPSNARWHKYFWDKEYQSKSNIRLNPGLHFWKENGQLSQANIDALQFFNIDNKIDFVEETNEYYDVFGFASAVGNSNILDVYFNRQDILRNFSLYFKDQAAGLIKQAEKKENRLFIPEVKNSFNPKKYFITTQFKINKYKFGDVTLSKKEMQVLILMLRGRTAIGIGKNINISPKTAESYIQTIKNKFNCSTRSDLFDKVFMLNISDLIKGTIVNGSLS